MSKRHTPAALSEAQLEIMNVIWKNGDATVAEVWETLAARRKVARNTVLTIMTRLEEKGWLRHSVDGAAFRYVARYPREKALQSLVRNLVDSAFGGSAAGLVMTLLEDRGASKEEAERIRAMIEKAEGGRQ